MKLGGPVAAKTVFLVILSLTLGWKAGWALGQEGVSGTPHRTDSGSPDEILQEADDLFREVSRLRGLPILRPVQKKLENRDFFRRYYLRLLQKEYPPQKKQAYEKAFRLFGFLPQGADLIETYLNSFMKVVNGLYDPPTQTLYIADWIGVEDQEKALVHELDHALQDQYFGLKAYLDQGADDTLDEQFARASVMEGEATAIALNDSLEDRGTDFTRLVNIADWVRINNLFQEEGDRAFGKQTALHDVVSFPYVYGAAFLQKYIKVYGWEGMRYLFRHPPTATHQVMHPETFFPRRRNPVGIEISDLSRGPLPGGVRIWDNTLGEYGLFLLLRLYLGAGEARQAVAGWQGDRVQVYESRRGGRPLLAAYVVFQGEEAANDFFSAYRELLDKKYDLDSFRRSDETIDWATVAQSASEVYVERFGRRVVLIEGTTADETANVRSALWDVTTAKGASTGGE